MNKNLLKLIVIISCLVIIQIISVYLLTDNGTRLISTENGLITGIPFGILYSITVIKYLKSKMKESEENKLV